MVTAYSYGIPEHARSISLHEYFTNEIKRSKLQRPKADKATNHDVTTHTLSRRAHPSGRKNICLEMAWHVARSVELGHHERRVIPSVLVHGAAVTEADVGGTSPHVLGEVAPLCGETLVGVVVRHAFLLQELEGHGASYGQPGKEKGAAGKQGSAKEKSLGVKDQAR